MDYVTFVVRIRLDDRHSMAEGRITHVASQETGYFRDLGAAVTFMEEHLDPANGRTGDGGPWGHYHPPMRDASETDRG